MPIRVTTVCSALVLLLATTASAQTTSRVAGRVLDQTGAALRPLIEDASVRSKSTTLWNGEVGYRASTRTRVVLEWFNIFNAAVADIDYFYTSRLPGEPAAGVEDVHTHPALPRSLRIGLQVSF